MTKDIAFKENKNNAETSKQVLITDNLIMIDLISKILIIAKTKATLLITGENGTGKEILSRLLHYCSSRRNMPMLTVNCGAVPSELVESRMFGYEKGAFTGSQSRNEGCNELRLAGLQEIDAMIDELDWQLYQEEKKMVIVNDFLRNSNQNENVSVQELYRLPLSEIPYGSELSELLAEHVLLAQRYTDSFPRVLTIRSQILEVVRRIPHPIENRINNMRKQRQELAARKREIVNDLERTYVANMQDNRMQSSFSIYQQLYIEIKVKLEQARMTRDIGTIASEQFVVLYSPYIHEEPVSPNKKLILISAALIAGYSAEWRYLFWRS